jgi:1-hydroxycarotenoid 3,4-desaturase
MPAEHVVIVGGGVGGLTAALLLSTRGVAVTLLERCGRPGGKLRRIEVGGVDIDAGPTVFTMPQVFEEIFAAVGASFSDYVKLRPAGILARHAWAADERLDLYADFERSVEAIGRFAGRSEAQGYRDFCARARCIYEALEQPFIHSPRPSLSTLVKAVGLRRLGDLWQISPFISLWSALGEHFRDPRLQQMFGRYATYCGSSPFLAPATLMLVAHVERQGVWTVEGGMYRVAESFALLAARAGATLRYGAEVREVIVESGRVAGVTVAGGERIDADAVLVNADTAAVSGGLLGRQIAGAAPAIPRSARSLSAITWATVAHTSGFPLVHHNVFFSGDYAAEFKNICNGEPPIEPTVYVCAQNRMDAVADVARPATPSPDSLLCLVNAPPNGDEISLTASELDKCQERTFALLERCGLYIERQGKDTVTTTPRDFDRLFPATGGALYGPASHGWMASFRRAGSRTRMPGLYLAGGSTHPGPGLPMAAMSGRLAAEAILTDFASTRRFRGADMFGGMSMP